jgi:hypothetical protein
MAQLRTIECTDVIKDSMCLFLAKALPLCSVSVKHCPCPGPSLTLTRIHTPYEHTTHRHIHMHTHTHTHTHLSLHGQANELSTCVRTPHHLFRVQV